MTPKGHFEINWPLLSWVRFVCSQTARSLRFPNCKNNKNQNKEVLYFKSWFLVTGWCNEKNVTEKNEMDFAKILHCVIKRHKWASNKNQIIGSKMEIPNSCSVRTVPDCFTRKSGYTGDLFHNVRYVLRFKIRKNHVKPNFFRY